MKRCLLIVLGFFLSIGILSAQDVIYSGYGSLSDSSNKVVRVWQNDKLLYEIASPQADAFVKSMQAGSNGQYLGGYVVPSNGLHEARIWHDSTLLFSCGQGSEVCNLAVMGDTVYAAGYTTIDSVTTAATVWKNGSLLFLLGDSTSDTKANAITISGNDIITAGYSENSSGQKTALIWQNDSLLYSIGDSAFHAELLAITYAGGHIYSAGNIIDSNGVCHAAAWCNDNLLYQLSDSSSLATTLLIEQGQVYVGGSVFGEAMIWKNGVIYQSMDGGTATLNAFSINDFGFFSVGKSDGTGKVWHNGTVLFSPDQTDEICGISVVESCNGATRTLPWHESFEPYDSDWLCWTQLDIDSTNNAQNAFWARNNDLSIDGAWSARHLKGDSLQEGWLISPKIYLQPDRDSTFMSFNSLELRPADHGYSGLWISTTGIDTTDFEEVWNQNNATGNWKTTPIDLRPYQGQTVYLGFKYAGANAHDWYIDNIVMDETYTMRDTVFSFPYTENFENALGDWYVIDNDHSGGLNNWKTGMYADSTLFAMHPAADSIFGEQEGWLISRPIKLQQDKIYNLAFAIKTNGTLSYGNSSLWIASDADGQPTTAYFNQIWEENAPCNDWKTVDLNLSSHSGHTVYLAFKYNGENAHEFLLDSISLTENENEYTITVVPNNELWGSTTGSGTYPTFDTVQIAATPFNGYEFRNWDDGNTENPRNIIVTQNQTYTANLGLIRYTITTEVSPEGAGTVTGGGLYEVGTVVSLHVFANTGFSFMNWSDGNTENPREIVVNGDATYTAVFESHQYAITTIADPIEGGTITGGGNYNYGDTAFLRPIPNENYMFLCWSDGIVSNPRTVIVTGNATYTAIFYLKAGPNYTVSVLSLNPELGTTSGSGTYPAGTEIDISATPFENAFFEKWDDGNTDNPRHVVVDTNLVFKAKFGAIPTYSITVVSINPLMGTTFGSGNYPEGETVRIGATPNVGFIFDHWDDGNTENPRNITVTGDKTYTAYFKDKPVTTYTITVYYNEEQGMVLGGGTYPAGSIIHLAAIPNESFVFFNWNDGVTDNPREVVVNHNMEFVAFFHGTGIEENNFNNVMLYPNPANDILHIKGLEEAHEIIIYNALGHQVRKETVDAEGEIQISDLSSGLYLIRLGNRNLKFFKE